MAKLEDIEGIGATFADKLRTAGVGNVALLLERGATPKGRKELAESAGIAVDKILEWVNHADLYRIRGVGPEFADLLEAAGVDTIPELAQRNAENLLQKMQDVNQQKKLVRRLPVLSQVSAWIAQAKTLERKVTY